MSWGSQTNLTGWGTNDHDNWCSDDKKDEKTGDKVRLKNDS